MRFYQPGDIVDESEPFAHVLSEEAKGERCDYCFKLSQTLSRCSNCRWMFYCNKKCQQTDWKNGHKYECKEYKLDSNRETKLFLHGSFSRLLLRLLLIQINMVEKTTQRYPIYNGKDRCFNDLMDHCEEIKSSEKSKRWCLAQKIYQKFAPLYSLVIDEKRFFSTFGKIVINSFSILDISLNEIGSGLFISGSIFDHDCQPNCSPIFDGIKLIIRCIRPFDASREPATITYIDLKLPREERQLKLKDQYYFNCACNRCVSSAPQNGCEGAGDTGDDNEEEDEDTSGRKLIALNKEFDSKIESQNWVQAFILGIKTLPLYEKIYKTFSPDFTVQLLRLSKIRNNINNGPQDVEELTFLINRLHEAILITHGKDHPLYKEEFVQLIGPA